MESIISHEQAICMLYCVQDNEENRRIYVQKIHDMVDLDMCYTKDPQYHMLVYNNTINASPQYYLRYIPEAALSGN
jgi:hypothetical protein